MIAIVAGLMSTYTIQRPLCSLTHQPFLLFCWHGGGWLQTRLSHFCWAFITGWKILRRPSFANCCLRHGATRRGAQSALWLARGDERSLPAPLGKNETGNLVFRPAFVYRKFVYLLCEFDFGVPILSIFVTDHAHTFRSSECGCLPKLCNWKKLLAIAKAFPFKNGNFVNKIKNMQTVGFVYK